MDITINAVLPILLLLSLGNILRRTDFLAESFWTNVDKLTYFVLFPALLMTKISQVNLNTIDFSDVLTFIVLFFVILSVLAYIIYHVCKAHSNQFSSIFQGILRFNSYIFFALAESLWGSSGLALAALFAGITIPIVNVFCVASFSVGSQQLSIINIIKPIAKNPLILGTLAGFLINYFPALMPQVLFTSMDISASAALPLALLSVGAAVRIKALIITGSSFSITGLWLTTIAGLIVSPALAMLMTELLGIDGMLQNIILLFAAAPTATSSYILSKQLKGDADMMAAIISLQTICSIITLSLVLILMH